MLFDVRRGRAIWIVLAMWLGTGCSTDATYTVTVDAGDVERQHTVASFALPPDATGDAYHLLDTDGREVPLQIDRERRAWFVLNHLEAGGEKTYHLEAGVAASEDVERQSDDGAVTFAIADQPVLRYRAEEGTLPRPDIDPVYRRGGYLHPVYTPSGTVLTDDYPPNHVHHHGIWAAWTKTEFEGRAPDFWNVADRTGTVKPMGLDTTWSGPVHGGFRARHRYVDLTTEEPVTVLNEQWTGRVYAVADADRPYRLFDLAVTQTTATSEPLRLPTYRYGGVGFRGRREWNGADSTFFLTSEGKDRSNGHATRARWCHIGGLVDGEQVGIAVLGHPDNFRAPQPMRIHPTEPFFNYAPSQAGDWSIEPGTPYVARYRFVTYDGPPDAALLDRLWYDYAHPPEVTVTQP